MTEWLNLEVSFEAPSPMPILSTGPTEQVGQGSAFEHPKSGHSAISLSNLSQRWTTLLMEILFLISS